MIAPDVKIVDIDGRHWTNLLSLYPALFKTEKNPTSSLIVLHREGHCLKAHHSRKGVLLGYETAPGDTAETLAAREGVDRVFLVEDGALRRIFADFQTAIDLEDEFLEQGLAVYHALRAEIGKGIVTHPPLRLPRVDWAWIRWTFRLVLPSDAGTVLYVFDGPTIYGSLILGHGSGGQLDLHTSHDSLVALGVPEEMGIEDRKEIAAAVEETHRKIWLGIYVEKTALEEIAASKNRLTAIFEARRSGGLVLDPFPLQFEVVARALHTLRVLPFRKDGAR